MLSQRRVGRGDADLGRIKSLYKRSFPILERHPMGLVLLLCRNEDNGEMLAFYDEGTFVGFTVSLFSGKAAYLLYLAVDGSLRSRGYGSAILSFLKERYRGKFLCLSVEPPEEDAPNNAQRLSRMAFYRRNGIVETGYSVRDLSGRYLLLSTEGFSPDECSKALGRMTCGLFNPRPSKV